MLEKPFMNIYVVNPFQPCVAFRVETCHSICFENQTTGFYDMQQWAEMS